MELDGMLRRARARRRTVRWAVALLGLAVHAAAHGGSYAPPKPPPKTPHGPPSASGRPAGAAPSKAPGGPGRTGAQAGSAASKGGRRGQTGILPEQNSADDWQIWWHDHEEGLLRLRDQLGPSSAQSRTTPLTGRGRAVEQGGGRRA